MPKNDFIVKIKLFYTFPKIAIECGIFWQTYCCHWLWKVAQIPINRPIWSHCWAWKEPINNSKTFYSWKSKLGKLSALLSNASWRPSTRSKHHRKRSLISSINRMPLSFFVLQPHSHKKTHKNRLPTLLPGSLTFQLMTYCLSD